MLTQKEPSEAVHSWSSMVAVHTWCCTALFVLFFILIHRTECQELSCEARTHPDASLQL